MGTLGDAWVATEMMVAYFADKNVISAPVCLEPCAPKHELIRLATAQSRRSTSSGSDHPWLESSTGDFVQWTTQQRRNSYPFNLSSWVHKTDTKPSLRRLSRPVLILFFCGNGQRSSIQGNDPNMPPASVAIRQVQVTCQTACICVVFPRLVVSDGDFILSDEVL